MPDETDAELFRHHMQYLAAHFTVLPLPVAVDQLRRGALPRLAAVITFDDGYASNYTVARPILQGFGFSASFFVATGLLGNGQMFNDTVIESIRRCPYTHLDLTALGIGQYELIDTPRRVAAISTLIGRLKYLPMPERSETARRIAELAGGGLSTRLMMNPDEVAQLHRDGMDVGCHTVNHPILANLSAEAARSEIDGSFAFIRELTGKKPVSFAYPNGRPGRDYHAEHVEMVRRAGFELAVSTATRGASPSDDLYQLPRIGIWSATDWKITANLASIYLQ
jgi:peptidoglycan/xylan/chitin deacetylase (PgdA/CDA1 family)